MVATFYMIECPSSHRNSNRGSSPFFQSTLLGRGVRVLCEKKLTPRGAHRLPYACPSIDVVEPMIVSISIEVLRPYVH